MVVEFNDLITALLGCNTNIGVLGSDSQAKAALCYVLKYITKPTTELTHVLSLWNNARKTIETYPSKAVDTGTSLRTAQHFLTRIANQMTSSTEISSMMAAAALLGTPAETASCSFQYVFVHAAMKYAEGYNNSSSDAITDDEEDSHCEIDEEAIVMNENYFDLFSSEDFDGESEPQVHDTLFTHALYDSGNVPKVSSTVYTGATGKIAVPQHIHYAHRGMHFAAYNLYEYTSIVSIIPKPKNQQSEKLNSSKKN